MAKNNIDNTNIIPILIANDKMQLSIFVDNFALWLIYFTIGNLNFKTRKQRKRSSRLLLDLIPIHKWDNVDLKLDIYHICLEVMTKYK